ncbi:transcriptional regulator with PAS, ATPase and Fis domain [Peribacillus deserti]|uniref:Transcriptional regulator with PAS, ATPase and Fis domain n=1 Tax=Peribacillus deserti TaxID=673318 RepID=A0ABS2QED1_9BACI|nr:PrpR N-terminal domain-containing protein [Peribacillus deserti]MBM7691520.1 transcriptional regulator with PAS, ATPase and Fis domain [Peribacillus deserti]
MTRILVITPYPALKDLFNEVNADLKKNIQVEIGHLYKGLSIVKHLQEQSFDIIISRGATARLLRQHCTIPVVDVKISGYDILRTLTLVKGYPGKIGLMSYNNTIQGADAIGTLLEMNLSFYSIDSEEEVEKEMSKALQDGVQVIIGDVITTSAAKEFGLNSILIQSGREAVMEAIKEAEQMVYYTKKQKKGQEFLEAAIQEQNKGIIAVNRNGEVIIMNGKAEQYFGVKAEHIVGKPSSHIHSLLEINNLTTVSKQSSEGLFTILGNDYVVEKKPLIVNDDWLGGLVFIEEISQVQKLESRIRKKIFSSSLEAGLHFNQLVALNNNLKEQLNKAQMFSKNNQSVLIYGETGTGKRSIAQCIHNESLRKEHPFIYFNSEAFSAEQAEEELFGSSEKPGAFEAAHNGTLYIDGIDKLPLSLQAKLIIVLKEKKIVKLNGFSTPVDFRLISAHTADLIKLILSGNFREDLFHLVNGVALKLPALRERKEDFPELVRWFIAAFNANYGKQFVGLRPDVMEELKGAHWPGNINQLKNTMESICMASTGPFIDLSAVKPFISELLESSPADSPDSVIEIADKTLGQLEREIISRVLKEEEYNQSNTAKRLGINRSTLWRKIKEEM